MHDAALTQRIRVQINGQVVERWVEPRRHLVDFLREDCGQTGSHLGCEHGVCGACTLRLDGQLVRGCLVLAVQADGRQVETVDTLVPSARLRALQEAFIARNALQCGYCTPGMLMTALDIVEHRAQASRSEVRQALSGNYCRCTGYQAIVDAVCDVLTEQQQGRLANAADQGVSA